MDKISIVIPTYPANRPAQALESIEKSMRTGVQVEVLIVEGTAPSLQRNSAVDAASGSFIYFLDDDSVIDTQALAVAHAFLSSRADVAAVGGPALTRAGADAIEHCAGIVMGSTLTAAFTAVRHSLHGPPRQINGEGLSLCNLMIRKNVLQESSGFKEHLYPSEDPEFLKRIEAKGEILYYLPEMRVFRSRRKNLTSLSRQFFRYGQGRANHIFAGLRARDFVFFVPSLLLLTIGASLVDPQGPWKILAGLYALGVLGAALMFKLKHGRAAPFLTLFLVIPTVHLSYGAGFLFGLAVKLKRNASAGRVNIIRQPL